MKRINVLLVIASLFGAMFVFPTTATAVSCPHGIVTFYDGMNGSGGAISFCADDYPASYSAASFDSNWRFNNNVIVDNHIESMRWDPTTPSTYRIRIFTGYYFNGTSVILTKGTGGVRNMPSGYFNTISSFLSCGTSCSDDPPNY